MFKQIAKIFSYSTLILILFNAEAVGQQPLTPTPKAEQDFFSSADARYSPLRGSAVIARPYFLDIQPSIMYEPDLNDGYPFKIWWFCGAYAKNPDINCTSNIGCAPADLDTTDRICFNQSPDGDNFDAASTKIVIAPYYKGIDDHLVGSPSVIKINGEYVMFYESYLNWVSTVNRFFSAGRGDNWITNGLVDNTNNLFDWEGSYNFERHLGFAPVFKKPDTHSIYSCEVKYNLNGGKYNRYLSRKPCLVGTNAYGTWSALNSGKPIFWFYDSLAIGRKALYACWDPAHSNSFTTDQSNCEGFTKDTSDHLLNNYRLGYVAVDLNSPDMDGALQNRIMMATSPDGKVWTHFQGKARGEAVIVPKRESASLVHKYPPQPGCTFQGVGKYDIVRTYGSGLPIALVRDNFLELYFTDDSNQSWKTVKDPITQTACTTPPFPSLWRIRIPISQLKDTNAYLTATRQQLATSGLSDIKWSPVLKRYFATKIAKHTTSDGIVDYQTPQVGWSTISLDPTIPPAFPVDGADAGLSNTFLEMKANPSHPLSPIQPNVPSSFGEYGGIMGDGKGNTLDFLNKGYSAIHLYYTANGDLEHNLIFLWGIKQQ